MTEQAASGSGKEPQAAKVTIYSIRFLAQVCLLHLFKPGSKKSDTRCEGSVFTKENLLFEAEVSREILFLPKHNPAGCDWKK